MPYHCKDTGETAYNYKQYLKTRHWRNLRADILIKANGICELCNQKSESLALHHKNYFRVGNESRYDILVLCPVCHDKQHFTPEGQRKRTLIHASLGHSFNGILFPLCLWEVKDQPDQYLNLIYTRKRRSITCMECRRRYDQHVRKALASSSIPLKLHTAPTSNQDREEITKRFRVKAMFLKKQAAEEFERKRRNSH